MNKIELKHEIFGLPNADKGPWYETWTEETHGLNRFVHPFKCILTGRPNCGKTTVIKNLILHIQASPKPFQTLIIVQPGTSREYDNLDPTIILSDIPDAESIVGPKNGKTLLIFDDFDLSKLNKIQQRNLSMLFRYISSHHNISIMLSYQSFFDIPTIMRKTCNYFVLWKTNNRDELNVIAKRVGYDKKMFQELFTDFITEKRDFLVIDQVSPYELRKNLFDVIELADNND